MDNKHRVTGRAGRAVLEMIYSHVEFPYYAPDFVQVDVSDNGVYRLPQIMFFSIWKMMINHGICGDHICYTYPQETV